MSFPVPTPAQLVEQFAAALDGVSFTASDGSPVTLNARDPNTLEGVFAVLQASGLFGLYLNLAYIAREMMVDTAQDLLPRHAAIWNVPRAAATFATGNAAVQVSADTQIPAGSAVEDGSNNRWDVVSTVAVGAGRTAVLQMRAEAAGFSGNVAANSSLTFVSPIAGVIGQTVTVDANGITGGLDIEPIETWRGRIIADVREPPGAGTPNDYKQWAKAAGAAYVAVPDVPAVPGYVWVAIAMPGPAVPTASQLSAVQAAINAVKPLGATATVIAATITLLPVQVALNPDGANARLLVTAAVASYSESMAEIGATLYASQLSDAISTVAGETSHRTVTPSADVVPAWNELLQLAAPTWASY